MLGEVPPDQGVRAAGQQQDPGILGAVSQY